MQGTETSPKHQEWDEVFNENSMKLHHPTKVYSTHNFTTQITEQCLMCGWFNAQGGRNQHES